MRRGIAEWGLPHVPLSRRIRDTVTNHPDGVTLATLAVLAHLLVLLPSSIRGRTTRRLAVTSPTTTTLRADRESVKYASGSGPRCVTLKRGGTHLTL
jgi:hypothetical protein